MSSDLKSFYSHFNFSVASDVERITYVFEDYRLDARGRMLYRGAAELALAPKAVETLLALVARRGEIVSKDELMQIIWAGAAVEESNLSNNLYLLRKTLGNRRDGKPFIETFRRRGYRFSPEVEVVEEFAAPKSGAQPVVNFNADLSPAANWNNAATVNPVTDAIDIDRKTKSSPILIAPVNWRWILAAVTFAVVFGLTTVLSFRWQPAMIESKTGAEISVTSLTNGGQVFDPTISPDGKYFVYHEQNGDTGHLWLQQTGKSDRRELIEPGKRWIGAKTFSPDGASVYFSSIEKGETKFSLYQISARGGAATKILSDIDSPVSFSPDGSEMVFLRSSENAEQHSLIIAANDGSREKVLLARSGTEAISIGGGAWSPDGKMIAFGAINEVSSTAQNGQLPEGNYSFFGIELQTGAVKVLSKEKWDNCFRLMWTPDGSEIVFIGTRQGESYTTRRDQVYSLSAATGAARRITTDGVRYQPWGLGVTNDDSLLAAPYNRLSQIWAMDANGDSRTAVQLTSGLADGRAGLAPLADGRVGYITRTGENLGVWTMNPDGTNRKQITGELPFVEELRAAPDGRHFIFSARRSGRSHLYQIDANGANLKQLTDGAGNEIDSTIAPDGKSVVYGSELFDGSRRKISVEKIWLESGAKIRLTDADHTQRINPHFSPNGQFISNVSDDKLFVLTANDFRLVKTYQTVNSPNLWSGARWLPNNEALTYLVQRNDAGNIWQQPITGGEARPLTDFTSGDIYNYAFSVDGSRLYVARGQQIRHAVLIENFK